MTALYRPLRSAVLVGRSESIGIEDEAVDLVLTSPPFWRHRDYGLGPDQLGQERTPEEYIRNLMVCAAEWRRVLGRRGSLVVNMGDRYMNKSLTGIPHMFVLEMVRAGWVYRAEIIQSKRNGLPESVRDRVRRSHEAWFHFTKETDYYQNVDAVREDPIDTSDHALNRHGRRGGEGYRKGVPGSTPHGFTSSNNPKGKLPPSVWETVSLPLTVPPEIKDALGIGRHPAPFTPLMTARFIAGWSPPGGVVLDPFGGSGTTAAVARAMGRIGVSLDANPLFGLLALWRVFVSDHGERGVRSAVDRRMIRRSAVEGLGESERLEQP